MLNRQVIREKFIERKENLNLSLYEIAKESGVSVSTLSRFQRNIGKEDADILLRLAVWVGMDNLSDGRICNGQTLENVRETIFSDETLTADNKRRLWRLFEQMYLVLGEEK